MGAKNNLEDKNYGDIAVTPYYSLTHSDDQNSPNYLKDKLFRAMLNAQLGIEQTSDGQYHFVDLNLTDGGTHMKNTCNYYNQWSVLDQFVKSDDSPSGATIPAPLDDEKALGNLFDPKLNGGIQLKIDQDDTYGNLFDTDYDYTTYFGNKINKGMDFPHLCFVGANNGEIDGEPFAIKDPEDPNNLPPLNLKGKLIKNTTDSNKANKELMDLMSQYKLFAFEYLTNIIKKSEASNGDVYKAAYNSPLKINGEEFNIDSNFDFNSSPLLPIKVNDRDQYTFMNDSLPAPFDDVEEIFALLFAVCPNLFKDSTIQYLLENTGGAFK
jgi:hypothetical protein